MLRSGLAGRVQDQDLAVCVGGGEYPPGEVRDLVGVPRVAQHADAALRHLKYPARVAVLVVAFGGRVGSGAGPRRQPERVKVGRGGQPSTSGELRQDTAVIGGAPAAAEREPGPAAA